MAGTETTFADIGVQVPTLLLPKEGTDLTKWCVIACDQYTSEPAYWKRVSDFVGEAPSMLNLIYPEVYMPEKRDAEIIASVHSKMKEYMDAGTLVQQEPGFVLIDRKTPSVQSRKGLLVALDLELYTFEKGSQPLIRPTEKTIEARLPPRIAIREKAPVESPHILVLIDDPERTVIEPLFERTDAMKKLYDFDLMEDSGHLVGHHITDQKDIQGIVAALRALADEERFKKKYDAKEGHGPLLFAVGDGNHSLATAKRCWEKIKASGAGDDHPARFALVELNNVHDVGLDFHPIYRLVEKVDPKAAAEDMVKFFEAQGSKVTFEEGKKLSEATKEADVHKFEFRSAASSGVYSISPVKMVLEAATLDSWLNGYMEANKEKGAELDYVHEAYTIETKSAENATTMGFLLPGTNKNDLIKTVVHEGTLPRKTFSMGHAPEKRFYFECRRVA